MTTPAQDAPLVLPAVAFRPSMLFAICVLIAGPVAVGAVFLGAPMVGVFFALGLGLGLANALLLRRSVMSITSKDHPLKSSMALNSAGRLLFLTTIGLVIAFYFRPEGLGVVFGMALFQLLLVVSTSLPVLKKLRAQSADGVEGENSQQ